MMINYIFLIIFNKNYIKIKNLYLKNFIKYHLFDNILFILIIFCKIKKKLK